VLRRARAAPGALMATENLPCMQVLTTAPCCTRTATWCGASRRYSSASSHRRDRTGGSSGCCTRPPPRSSSRMGSRSPPRRRTHGLTPRTPRSSSWARSGPSSTSDGTRPPRAPHDGTVAPMRRRLRLATASLSKLPRFVSAPFPTDGGPLERTGTSRVCARVSRGRGRAHAAALHAAAARAARRVLGTTPLAARTARAPRRWACL
jgi:hypothetical protein